MKIFITGGTGFIGQKLIQSLLEAGDTVYYLSRRQEKNNLSDNARLIYVPGQLENPESYKKILAENIDIIYHLAAIPGQKWGVSEKTYSHINVLGTENLLKACQTKIKRFIFCSSINAITHDNFLRDPYGQSKFQAEHLFKKETDFETVILRPAIVYGPGDTRGMLIKICQLINRRLFFIIGSGKNVIPLVYIDDLIQAFVLAKNAPKDKLICEIVGPDSATLGELVKKISQLMNKKNSAVHIPIFLSRIAAFFSELVFSALGREPLLTQMRIDNLIKNNSLDSEKAKKELGYTPQIKLATGLTLTIDWYKKNGYL